MGLRSDLWSFWWCKALSRSRSFATTLNNYLFTILVVLTTINYTNANSLPGKNEFVFLKDLYFNFSFIRENYCINYGLTHTRIFPSNLHNVNFEVSSKTNCIQMTIQLFGNLYIITLLQVNEE